jgi:lipopolysaccharide export system protein LptA
MAKMNAKFMPMMLFTSLAPSFAHAPLCRLRALNAGGRLHRLLPLLAVMVLAATSSARAEKADRNQPLNFAADAARVDDVQRLNILTGNVEITKGTMVVRSDRVEVKQNADGSQTATALGGSGGRAYFRQKRDGLDESIEGEAERVVYEGKADTVHFSGRAIMRRLNGKTVTDEVTGQAILYDNKTAVFQVLGSTSPAGTPTKGRVRGVITPRPATEAPAASPTPDGAR